MKDISHIRHSLAHLLAAAVLELWPDTKRAIGPAIDNGFYYDFEFSTPISDADLPKIEKKMRELLPSWTQFERTETSPKEALELFKDNPYKQELIEEFKGESKTLTLYDSGAYTDLCKGGHVENPSTIDPQSFKLSHLAGAYWRGDEKNTMLTRIYGFAFNSKDELEKYIELQEEAKKRDHRKLGRELDLFTFSELVGPGLPLWTPRGTLLRNLLDEFVWELRKDKGYAQVDIPHLTKKDLYITSGHWEKFGDELFRTTTRENHEFALKPMNCPHHTQIYKRKMHSYREMPQRYANTTKVYRDEQTGELSGLSRVRSITQDDAHVFCRYNQVKEEILSIWDIVSVFYGTAGFELSVRLSLHDPNEPQNYLGDKKIWDEAENQLRDIVKEKGFTVLEAVGEAAFYGPKIDFVAKDSLGREWQVATIQLDMNLPERFDLTCVNEKGEHERIVMLHAAIMGSLERFLSVYIEHVAGNFPLWLSPVQIRVLPIADSHKDFGLEVCRVLKESDIRVELDDGNETLGKKIRQAKLEKVPYFLVIGDKEVESKNVTLENRDGGEALSLNITDLVEKLQKETTEKK